MPFLALIWGLISSSVLNLFGYFLVVFGRKFTVATATVLALIATTLSLIYCLKSILAVVVASILIPSWIYTAIAWFIPTNFIACISSILAGKICRNAYNLVVTKIDLIAKAN